MIERISFRAFGLSGRVEGLRKLNVFVGPNGGGKSVALHALYASAALDAPKPPRDFFGDDRRAEEVAGFQVFASGSPARFERTAFVDVASATRQSWRFAAQSVAEAGALHRWAEATGDALRRIFPKERIDGVGVSGANADDGEAFVVFGDDGAPPRPARSFGEGFLATLHVVALFHAMKATSDDEALVIADSIDGRFDPTTLERLLDEIAVVVADAPIQAAIATHNIEALTWLACALEEGKIDPGPVAVFLLERQGTTVRSRPFFGRAVAGYMEFFGDVRLANERDATSLDRWMRGACRRPHSRSAGFADAGA